MARRFLFSLVLIVVLIAVFSVLSGVLHAQGNRDAAFERVKEVQEKHTSKLLAIKGVVGTAVGLDHNRLHVVKVFVERAGVSGIARKLDGVVVQTVVTGKIYARRPGRGGGGGKKKPVDPTSRFDRPVPIGVSTGHPSITAGTIGCRVTDGTDVYALSNNHVYAAQNQANIGDSVLQPGTIDGGVDPGDAIGTLADFETIKFDGSDNVIDAAIAVSSDSNLGKATPSDGYGAPKSSTVSEQDLRINQKVKKYGRTTGLTKGQVYGLNATVTINYGGGKKALFVGQIIITPGSFSAGGDSGSVIVIDDRKGKRTGADDLKPVGLLFAGSSMITIANPIDAVLSELGVTIDGD